MLRRILVSFIAQLISRDHTIVTDALRKLRSRKNAAYWSFRQHYACTLPDEFGKNYLTETDFIPDPSDQVNVRPDWRKEPNFKHNDV